MLSSNKKYNFSLFTISDKHLSEEVSDYNNIVKYMTGFTGDTAMFLYGKKKSYLIIDGRFAIQAKNEMKNKKIEIVVLDATYNLYDFLFQILNKEKGYITISFNPATESINKIEHIINTIDKINKSNKKVNIKLVSDKKYIYEDFYKYRKNIFNMSSAPLFKLSNKKPSLFDKQLTRQILGDNDIYVTNDKSIIAYLSDLRYEFSDINNIGILFDSFMILNEKKINIYIHDYLSNKLEEKYKKYNIYFKSYDKFYSDLKLIKKFDKVLIDKNNTAYEIYYILKNCKLDFDVSYIEDLLSIRKKYEIENIKKSNIIDNLSMINIIYNIKKMNFNTQTITEYNIKQYVDNERRKNKYFLCPSFETIVAYNSNSAICHYVPKFKKSKKIRNEGILLIDSGGHYKNGTTDITRTISLYRNKVPKDIINDYTLVLKSLLKLQNQKFPYGYTGRELDLIARENLYNNLIDFNHGTGHGIGYVTKVHEGPNNLSPGIQMAKENNILEENQVNSIEPGIYKANKYGIRLENDVYVKFYNKNKYGKFLQFSPLTLCPFETDLIDIKLLDSEEKKILNNYNEVIYNSLSKYLKGDILEWLKRQTKKIL